MSQLIMDETEPQQTFQKFELVWAKILGWPWWPARITQIPSENSGNYRVQFFADTSHAFLPAEKIMNFIQGRIRHSTPKGNYRNFAKALGLANKLLQTNSSMKEEAQSECTPREKLSPQQIQIINYSQQVQTISKADAENKLPPAQGYNESVQSHALARKPKQPLKRRERLHAISKSSKCEQDQQNLRTLLRKYKLEQIMDRRPRNQLTKATRKTKLIGKNVSEKSSIGNIWGKAARKVCKALSTKDIDLQQRYKISLSLLDSLFRNKEKGVQGVHRALFQWISSNDGETIQKNYSSWPTESKCDHLTDCS